MESPRTADRFARQRLGRAAQRGLTLVELMVGLALGLAILLAMLQWLQTQIRWQRDTTIDTRLLHDLKASGELIHRVLRRAGRTAEELPATAATAAEAAAAERRLAPPRSAELSVADDGRSIALWSARGALSSPAGAGSIADERIAIRLADGAVQMRIDAGAWQALTDRTLMRVSHLQFDVQRVHTPCGRPASSAWPVVTLVHWRLHAESARDRRVTREWRGVTRLRHDEPAPAASAPSAAATTAASDAAATSCA